MFAISDRRVTGACFLHIMYQRGMISSFLWHIQHDWTERILILHSVIKTSSVQWYGPPRPLPACMGMIFGTRAQPRVMSSKFSDDFRKMDPCKPPSCMGAWVGGLHGCMGPFSENGSMQDGGLHGSSPARSSVWCSPAVFFSRENRSLGFCSLKQCFLHSTKTIFNGTRLDRRGLKS